MILGKLSVCITNNCFGIIPKYQFSTVMLCKRKCYIRIKTCSINNMRKILNITLFCFAICGCAKSHLEAVRPGGVNSSPYWNTYSVFFQYPPVLEFKDVNGAKSYSFKVTTEGYSSKSFLSNEARADLTKIWSQVPENSIVTVTASALDTDGASLGEAQTRSFMKTARFKKGLYPKKKEGYRRAALRIYDYVFDSPPMKSFRLTGKPDPSYKKNCYPSKMYASIISMCCAYAKLRPERKVETVEFACLLADYLIKISMPEGSALEYFTPTYATGFGHSVAKTYKGQTMTLYPASAGRSLADLSEFIKKDDPVRAKRYLDHAEKIAATFLRIQGEDGTWYARLSEETGLPDGLREEREGAMAESLTRNRAIPTPMILFFETLYKITSKEKYRKAGEAALSYIEREGGPLATFNWEGQFEDGPPTPPYLNLTMSAPCAYADYVLQKFPNDKKRVRHALDIARFTEDQFTVWERPLTKDGRYITKSDCPHIGKSMAWRLTTIDDWGVPGVMEQFDCYNPIDCHTGRTAELFMRLGEILKDSEYIDKALALCDSIVNKIPEDGNMPTHWMGRHGAKFENWYNCMIITAQCLERVQDKIEINGL